MKTLKIVLDTNVLFVGLYSSSGASHQILRKIDDQILKPVISTPLVFEYEEILKRKQSDLEISDQEIEIIIDNLCYLSYFQKIYYLWIPYLKDPKDYSSGDMRLNSKTVEIKKQYTVLTL